MPTAVSSIAFTSILFAFGRLTSAQLVSCDEVACPVGAYNQMQCCGQHHVFRHRDRFSEHDRQFPVANMDHNEPRGG